MRKIFLILIILRSILFGQSTEQIKQAKEYIKQSGMPESQAREAAKVSGYSDKQINAAIQKEKTISQEANLEK